MAYTYTRLTRPPALLIPLVTLSLLFLYLGFRSPATRSRWSFPGSGQKDNTGIFPREVERAGNRSLGFEKVLVLGLKERTDKRDAMVLTSSVTGFDVEFIDAVRGEDVLDVARPAGFNDIKGGALGSWRAHINAIRSIPETHLSSALIMEDDVDWDVRLPSQMPVFAQGVRYLTNISSTTPQNSPYGDDWDVLWPGHCGEVPPEKDEPLYIISNDETVAPKEHQGWKQLLNDYPDQTRIVHRGVAPLCVFAYAVSRRGAQKLLAALTITAPWDLAFDNQLAYACKDKLLDLKCYSVEPMLFFHHKAAGRMDRDSDIGANGEKGNEGTRERGGTECMVWSARLNLERMIKGVGEWVVQW